MLTLLSVYRKRIIGKQARVEWSIGVIGAVALLATVGPIESDAAGLGQTREYGACMRLARVSPTEGFETALSWSDAGGGGAAKHCAAVALFERENPWMYDLNTLQWYADTLSQPHCQGGACTVN